MVIKENIIMEATFVDNASKVMKTVRTSLEHLKNGFDKTTSVISTVDKQGKIATQTINKLTPTIKRFKMEWLGVMFAGMALTRTFGGIIRQQNELWGISEGFSSMLTVVMIPVMETLSDILWPIFDFFMNLPEGVQKAIGVFVILATVFGSVLFIGGQLMLALQSIGMAFGNMFSGIGSGVTVAVGGLGSLLAIIGLIMTVIVGMVVAWRENFMQMKEVVKGFVQGIKLLISSIIDIFKGVFKILIGIINGDVDMIKEGFTKLLKGFGNLILGITQTVINAVLAITIGVIRVVAGIIQTVINSVISIGNAISRVLGIKSQMNKIDLIGALSKINSGALVNMPSFKEGGIMPYTGVAYLHKGETITPANQTNNSPNIVINANVASSYDVRKLADEIKKYLTTDYERVTQRRTL